MKAAPQGNNRNALAVELEYSQDYRLQMSLQRNEPSSKEDAARIMWDTAERVLRIGTGTVAIVYTLGFLVVLIAHSRYGIVLFDLFRARVLAAGLLITLFSLLPVLTGRAIDEKFSTLRYDLQGVQAYLGYFIIGIFLLWANIIVACDFYPLFPGTSRTVFHISSGAAWWTLTAMSLMLLVVKFPKSNSFLNVAFLLVVLVVLNFCVFVVLSKTLLILAFWVLTFSAAPMIFRRYNEREKAEGRQSKWYLASAGYCVVAIIAFTHLLYYKITPAWGGGLPQPVTINLMKSIPFANSGKVQAFLIDETDKGYYLIYNANDHGASFIPRDAIESIDFEEVK